MSKKNEGYCFEGDGYTLAGGTDSKKKHRPHDVDAWKKLLQSKAIQDVYCNPKLVALFKEIFNQRDSGVTHMKDATYFRLMNPGNGTPEHSDYYYYKANTWLFSDPNENDATPGEIICGFCGARHSRNELPLAERKRLAKNDFAVSGSWHCKACSDHYIPIWNCWFGMGSYPIENSVIAVQPRSHLLREFNMPKYHKNCNMQVPGDYDKQTEWRIPSDLSSGDILIMNMKTVHASTANRTNRFRCSIDTRYGVNNLNIKTEKIRSKRLADPRSKVRLKIPAFPVHVKQQENLVKKEDNTKFDVKSEFGFSQEISSRWTTCKFSEQSGWQ